MHVLLVVNTRLYRDGLAAILRSSKQFSTVTIASTLDDALTSVRSTQPDIVLVDMTTSVSLHVLRALTHVTPSLSVIALPVETDAEIIACAEAGAVGFLSPSASAVDLESTVASVARGELHCSPQTARRLLNRVTDLAGSKRILAEHPILTRREKEVVDLIEAGFSNKEIAQRLFITVATAKNHVHNILEKLQLSRRGEVAARLRPSFVRISFPSTTR